MSSLCHAHQCSCRCRSPTPNAAHQAYKLFQIPNVNPHFAARDLPFINTYAMWTDEIEGLGLDHTHNTTWEDTVCYFQEGREVRTGRAYTRLSRHKLRQHLGDRCRAGGDCKNMGQTWVGNKTLHVAKQRVLDCLD